jgi:hypothetical protein
MRGATLRRLMLPLTSLLADYGVAPAALMLATDLKGTRALSLNWRPEAAAFAEASFRASGEFISINAVVMVGNGVTSRSDRWWPLCSKFAD